MDSVNIAGFDVLNMLSAKWVIMPAQDGSTLPVENPYAMGNAWFVDNVRFVENAEEEMWHWQHRSRVEAVVDRRFSHLLDGFQPSGADSLSTIALVDYDSDFVTYNVNANKEELAVFSEIYYPKGWQITVDGQPAEMFRVNYALRGLVLPEGTYTVEFRFDPPSIRVTDTIAYIALGIMLIAALFLIYRAFRTSKE